MLTPLRLRSPVLGVYVKVPVIPVFGLYGGPQPGTEGNVMTGANALLVIVPLTTPLGITETVVPAVALPVTRLVPDTVTPARVERTLPDTLELPPTVIVPLLRTLARLPFVAGYPPVEL